MFGLKKKKSKPVLPENIEDLIDKTKKKKKQNKYKKGSKKTKKKKSDFFHKKIILFLLILVIIGVLSIYFFDIFNFIDDSSEEDLGDSNDDVKNVKKAYVNVMANVTEGVAPLRVFFNCSYGNFLNTSLMSYSWDFGDGGKSVNPELEYIFLEKGEFVVNLTLVDSEGVEASGSVVISVS